jgi:hypothetical protein
MMDERSQPHAQTDWAEALTAEERLLFDKLVDIDQDMQLVDLVGSTILRAHTSRERAEEAVTHGGALSQDELGDNEQDHWSKQV